MEETPVTLSYARPGLTRRRLSKLAIVSLLIPILTLPTTIFAEKGLQGTALAPWVVMRLPPVIIGLGAAFGLVVTGFTLDHIQSSTGRLRGRMLALIGFALDVALLFFAVTVLWLWRG